MFRIGDEIVHPMHGAGVIRAVQEWEVLGVKQDCYILELAHGNMDVMIPFDSAEKIGVRKITDGQTIDGLFSYLQEYTYSNEENWNKRYRENLEKIRTGDFLQMAQVLKELMCREKKQSLSAGEKKMLQQVKQILYSEIILVKNISYERTDEKVKECIGISV